MNALTVVGGGLGGLVAAITAVERGAEVRLYEAHSQLGGRWRVSDPPFVLHEGPHVAYRDGPLYPWLRRRGLLGTWRDRVEFRRDAVARGRTGAVDYPGTTWRDRPAIDRDDGVYLVGDQVAAPGLLSEVSVASGVRAGQLAASRDRLSPGLPAL